MSESGLQSKWSLVKLADCARIVSGATPSTSETRYWNGDINWVTPKDISDLDGYPFLDSTPRTLTAEGLASCSAEILPRHSVLLSSRAPIGLVAINRIPVATNQGFKSFVPDTSRLDSGFLYHWLRANRSFLENLGTGATFKEVSKCPYCGFGDIKGVHHSKREAYDHFLPKGTYPFNSVNFHNLAPMCHDCNSSYKLKLDPIKHIDPVTRKNNGGRRRAFYSYGNVNPGINISVAIKTKDVTNLAPDQIDLQLTAQGRAEEVEAWKDVFGIEERYRAKCCGENDGKGWLSRVRDECQNYNLTPQQMLIAEIRSAENRPWADSNFLKKPFLEACNKIGII
jgi:hypothetical protein